MSTSFQTKVQGLDLAAVLEKQPDWSMGRELLLLH